MFVFVSLCVVVCLPVLCCCVCVVDFVFTFVGCCFFCVFVGSLLVCWWLVGLLAGCRLCCIYFFKILVCLFLSLLLLSAFDT